MKSAILGFIVIFLVPGNIFAASTDPNPQFIRGDANSDEKVDLGDAIAIIFKLFAGEPVRCLATADANGDSALDLADPVYLLGYLFLGDAPPPAPFPACAAPIEAAVLGCNDPVCPAAIQDECSIVIHGTIVQGVECPDAFLTDEKKYYQLKGFILHRRIGWTGTITAKPHYPVIVSICMQGEYIDVCTAVADPPAPAGGPQ